MPSVEELLSIAEFDTDTRSAIDSRIEIDADTRIIQMMPQDELFGVESDEKSERKYFKVPKIVGNGVDLSKLQLRINYQNASRIPSGKDMYIVTDATVYNDEWVYFSWELSRKVTQYKGNIYFVVCAVKADSKGNITNEWNTTLAEGKVLEGLEVEISQEQQYQASDYLEQLKQQLLDYSKEIKETFPSDYTEMSEDVKNLKGNVQKLDDNKITKFYTNNNGDTVLNDSDDGKIRDLVIYGKSEQKQYKGTNLAIVEYPRTPDVRYGVTFTVNDDGSVTLNGTSTTDRLDYYLIGSYEGNVIVNLDADKDYTIRAMPIEGIEMYFGTNTRIKIVGKTDVHTKGISLAFIFIRILKAGITYNNVVIYPQINEGTTLLDYEPYVGGKPSPSPEYPQEIKAVVNPVIKVSGKNLWDSFKTLSLGNVKQKNGTYIATEVVMKIDVRDDSTGARQLLLKANNTYAFSLKTTVNISKGRYLCLKYFNGKIHNIPFRGKNFVNFTPDEDVEKVGFVLYESVVGDKVYDVQLEMGSEATPYQPYQETQANLPYELNAIPVSSGGNVTIDGQQYIADYVDVERGKLVRMCKKVEYNGDENWKLQSVNANNIANFALNGIMALDFKGLSNKLFLQTTIIENTNSEGFYINSAFQLYIRISKNRNISTVTEFKNFLSKNPIRILFATITPEEIDLTPEEIAAFKALSTYYPKTYINAESEQLNAYTMFNYSVSMEKGWEYVKQQIGDTRKYVYDMDTKLTETEASTLEAKIDTAILSEMIGG